MRVLLLTGAIAKRLIRQLMFGVGLAVLVGPYDLFGGLSVGLVIITAATIPTSQLVFNLFSGNILGIGALSTLGATLIAVMVWVIDPLYRLNLNLVSRVSIFVGVFAVLLISGWLRLRRQVAHW